MEEVRRISKNTTVLVAAKVISSGLVFLLAILINRELGPERAGIYTYAFVLYTIFQVIPDFGIGNISVRDVSRTSGACASSSPTSSPCACCWGWRRWPC